MNEYTQWIERKKKEKIHRVTSTRVDIQVKNSYLVIYFFFLLSFLIHFLPLIFHFLLLFRFRCKEPLDIFFNDLKFYLRWSWMERTNGKKNLWIKELRIGEEKKNVKKEGKKKQRWKPNILIKWALVAAINGSFHQFSVFIEYMYLKVGFGKIYFFFSSTYW